MYDCGECRDSGQNKYRRCPFDKQADDENQFALFTIDGVDYKTCPSGTVDQELAGEAFYDFNHYRLGFLPHAGGIYDQPERFLQMIEVIEAVIAQERKNRQTTRKQWMRA